MIIIYMSCCKDKPSQRNKIEEIEEPIYDSSVNNYIDILNKIKDISTGITKDTSHKVDNEINIPRIMILGGQSAGKSSFIQSIIKRDVFDISTGMASRALLDITVKNAPSDFGRLSYFCPLSSEKKVYYKTNSLDIEFNKKLKELTNMLCSSSLRNGPGDASSHNGEEVTDEIIYIDLHIESESNINVQFVDSIGLILNAHDKDLPYKIQDIVMKEANKPNTIIVLLCKIGNDIETDIAVTECLKMTNKKIYIVFSQIDKLDKKGMNEFIMHLNKFPRYKFNNYFFVNNRQDNIKWYSRHVEPSILNKCGVINIMNFVNNELIEDFKEQIKPICNKLITIKESMEGGVLSKLTEIESDESKKYYMLFHLHLLSVLFTLSCESNLNSLNIGHDIKDIIQDFTNKIKNIELNTTQDLKPFVNKYGSFVESNISQSRLISKYLTREEMGYISGLGVIFEHTIIRLCELFNSLINKILHLDEFSYYPHIKNPYTLKLCSLSNMIKYISDKCKLIIDKNKNKLLEHSKNHLQQVQQNINMTDESNQLYDSFINCALDEDIEKLRTNLVSVHLKLKTNYMNVCTQMIFTLMKTLQYNLFIELVSSIDSAPKINTLFYESETVQKKRNLSKVYSDKIKILLSDLKTL